MRGKAFRREQVKKFQKSRAKYWTTMVGNPGTTPNAPNVRVGSFIFNPGLDWRKNVRDVRWFAGLGKHKVEYSRKDISGRLDHKKFLRDLDRWNKKLMLEEASKFPYQFDEDYYDYYNTAA